MKYLIVLMGLFVSVNVFSMDLYQQQQLQQLEAMERIETSLEWIEWNQFKPVVVHVKPINKLTKEEIRFNKCMSKQRGIIYRPDLCRQ